MAKREKDVVDKSLEFFSTRIAKQGEPQTAVEILAYTLAREYFRGSLASDESTPPDDKHHKAAELAKVAWPDWEPLAQQFFNATEAMLRETFLP